MKVHSTKVMCLCTKIMRMTILSYLSFSPWVNRACLKRTYWNEFTFFHSCIYHVQFKVLYFQYDILTSHKEQLSLKRYFIRMGHAKGRSTSNTEKKRYYWNKIFIGEIFGRNVEINAINLITIPCLILFSKF